MKIKCLGLFFLLLLGYMNVSGQDTLKIEAIDAEALRGEFNPEVSLTEKEALVIIRSICPFTFDSNVDKIIVVSDSLQKDDLHYYAIKLNVPSRARRLRMISDDYITIIHSLGDLQPEETKRFDVTGIIDPIVIRLIKEGMKFFGQSMYEQARTKFTEAMNVAIGQEIEATTVLIERATLCIDSKAKAEQYYSNAQWCAAVTEYEKVIGANQSDTYCKEKYKSAHEKCMNTERIITGTVANLQGQPVRGVSVVIEEQVTDKNGKVKYSWSKQATKTNAAGKFQVKALMKTRKLQYWLYHFRKNEIGLTNDSNVVDIVINDGSGENSIGSSSNSNTNNSGNTKSTTTNKRKSSLQTGGLNTRKISD